MFTNKNSQKAKSQSKNSQIGAKEGNILERNLVNLFTALFECENVIKDEDREYEYRLICVDFVKGNFQFSEI